MTRVLILGGTSFIAGKFIKSNEYSFGVISRRLVGYANEEQIDDLFNVTLEMFEGYDAVINFAAIVHKQSNLDGKEYSRINTDLPLYLAEMAKRAGVKQFVQMSTVAVYGDRECVDESSPLIPKTPYAKTKLAADVKLMELKEWNFTVTIVRPPLVYGGGKAPGNMMKLISASLRGIPMPFKGISNKRDFINVDNLTGAISILINNCLGGIYLPTDKRPVSTEEILLTVKQLTSSRVRLIKLPNIAIKLLSVLRPSLAKKLFGSMKVVCNMPAKLYEPHATFKEGMRKMVKAAERA